MAEPASADRIAKLLDGIALAAAFEAAATALSMQRDALNAINVFPVPDGDTGTNMSLTMRSAVDAAPPGEPSAAVVAKAMAQGALMGARGNSGVILSQVVSAFAQDAPALDGAACADALERGRAAAYRVVSQPREGTILTALTAAAAAASAVRSDAPAAVLSAASRAAQEATDRTPELLPVLKEAGVVDAGAQGLAVMLDGMARALRGEAAGTARDLGAIDASWLSATRRAHDEGEQSGFCTEFVVTGEQLDAAAMRSSLSEMGTSLIVVGGSDAVRVHVHTHQPDDVLAYARTIGTLAQEKVENMESQFQALAADKSEHPPAATGVTVVTVGAGTGIEALFESLGASAIVSGGQTMNPSAGDIADAIKRAGGDSTIVLPNNKNIILAAEQAASAMGERIRVLPTRSIPQGVAALIAFNPESALDENVAEMTDAAANVLAGEVTLAARTTNVNGIAVREGQPIGLVDDMLTAACNTVDEAAREVVQQMLAGRGGALVTLYAGEGAAAAETEALAAALREEHGCEVEIVEGGQPHYPYLIGVE